MSNTNPTPEIQLPHNNNNTTPNAEAEAEELAEMRHSPSNSPTHNTLIETILARHTSRIFHPTPVPLSILESCLSIAQSSPSSSNVQPWRLTFTHGPRLERLRTAMVAAATSGQQSTVPPIPEQFTHHRSEVGHALYGPSGYGISREDTESYHKAKLRNFEFMGAPLVGVVGIDESLMVGGADVMSVGLYVQTLVLLLTERGLGTCLLVSTSGYADVLRRELGIPENIVVLCTLGIGYEDSSQRVNTFKMQRDQWKNHVNFVLD